MLCKGSEVFVHGEELVIPGDSQCGDEAVRARKREAGSEAPVPEASRLDMVARSGIHDLKGGKEPPLEISEPPARRYREEPMGFPS